MTAALLMGFLSLGLAVGAGPASASGSCTGGESTSWFAGATKDTYDTTLYGVRANIEYQSPSLCNSGNSPSWSSAWSMLLPQNLAATQWAQSGYMKIGDQSTAFPGTTGVHTFAQYTYKCNPSCSGANVVTFFGPAPTGSEYYSTYLRSSDGRIAMYCGSTYMGEMNRSVTGEWSAAWGGQFMGETKNSESDVPGVKANHVRFNYIQKYDSAGNINFIQNITNYPVSTSRYNDSQGAAAVGGRWLDIWTDPL